MKNTKIKQTIEKLNQQVLEFADSTEYMNYLKFIRKFHSRSYFNKLLIFIWRPKATYVMGYKQWIEKLNRIPVACVTCRAIANKDCSCKERIAPIRIPQLAPMTYKKINDETEEEESKLYFKEVYVFAIEDTEPIPDLPIKPIESLTEWVNKTIEDTELEEKLIQIIIDNKFTFKYDDTGSDTLNGWTDFHNKEIVVSNDRPKAQQIKTLIHEIGHMFAHDRDSLGDMLAPQEQRECEAESIAYVVCDYFGIDTSSYSIGYLTSWTNGEEDILKDSVKAITDTSSKIINLLGGE